MELKLATCSDDYKCKIWRTPPVDSWRDTDASIPPAKSGEVAWYTVANSYAFGRPFEDKICYDNTLSIHSANKSKRKLFLDETENEENRCNNSPIRYSSNKRKKMSEETSCQNNVRFAAYPSSSPTKMTNVLTSPRKSTSTSNGIMQSPRKLNITPIKDKRSKLLYGVKEGNTLFSSPTDHLPNIILDGYSPHGKVTCQNGMLGSGKKTGCTNSRKVDWLTEMSQQKKNTQFKKVISKQQPVFQGQIISKHSVTIFPKS